MWPSWIAHMFKETEAFWIGVLFCAVVFACVVLPVVGFSVRDSQNDYWQKTIVAHGYGYYNPQDNSFHWATEKNK